MMQRFDERRDLPGLRVPASIERRRQPDHDPGQALFFSREPVDLPRDGLDAFIELGPRS